MKEYLSMDRKKREEITEKIQKALSQQKEVVFGFIFGSFLDAPTFRDIDIGVYVKDIKTEEVFNYELKLSQILSRNCNLPFDILEVKVLNFAPTSFLNNIFKQGELLFCRNQKLLADMIENTSLNAIANEHIAFQSLNELIPK